MESVFAYEHYKDFISNYLKSSEKSWGLKARICEAMNIHNAYLSQVLNGEKHLSLEQIEGLGHHLHLTDAEMDYLLVMVQKDRAGTKTLEEFFARKLTALREKHAQVSDRLGKKETVSEKDQNTYFSSWTYSAVHSCVLVPRFRTIQTISSRLGIQEGEVRTIVGFLKEVGLVREEAGSILPTSKWIRLKSDSPLMVHHHLNARFKASEAIYKQKSDDLHYSGFFAFSRDDYVKLKELWLKTLQETQKIIKPSQEEELFSISLDVFSL